MEPYCGSMNKNVTGKKNNAVPAILFKAECLTRNLFLQRNPHMTLPALITAMIPIHSQSQTGSSIRGRILKSAADAKIKSAAVSSFEPNALAVFVFLAIVPSIISVSPQIRYAIKKRGENTGRNNIPMLNRIRQLVTILAAFLRITIPEPSVT